eukprot:3810286-Rhodomonas_salina.2
MVRFQPGTLMWAWGKTLQGCEGQSLIRRPISQQQTDGMPIASPRDVRAGSGVAQDRRIADPLCPQAFCLTDRDCSGVWQVNPEVLSSDGHAPAAHSCL